MENTIEYDFRNYRFTCQLGTNGVTEYVIKGEGWVRDAAFTCDWDLLPETPVLGDLARFALLIEGYACMEKLQEVHEVNLGLRKAGDSEGVSYVRFVHRVLQPQFELAEKGEHEWQGSCLELWCALFAIQRGCWKEGGLSGDRGTFKEDHPYFEDPNTKGLWPKLRSLLKLNKVLVSVGIDTLFLPVCRDRFS